MVHKTSTTELRRMTMDDIEREIRAKQMTVAKMRLGLKIGSEKDSARYKRERKQLAQLRTVQRDKMEEKGKKGLLKTKRSSGTLPAPALAA